MTASALHRPLAPDSDRLGACELAASPRWEPSRTAAIPGRCRGVLLADWAENFTERWGARAVARVRQGLRAEGLDLPDAPGPVAWYPVGAQLRLTELLLDEVVDGDVDALRDALLALVDGYHAARFIARRLGLERLVVKSSGLHRRCYDVGHSQVQTQHGSAIVSTSGAALVTHPTWQLLQLLAFKAALKSLCCRPSRRRAATCKHCCHGVRRQSET